MDHLRSSSFFGSVSEDSLVRVATVARLVEVNRNGLLFLRGDDADAAYIILSGYIAIEVLSSMGRATRVATLGDGALFGELALLDEGKRTADARALEDCSLVRLPKSIILELFDSDSGFAMATVRDVVAKLRRTNIQVESISVRPLIARVSDWLLKMTEEGLEQRNSIFITQSELAERLLASREKVNICLQKLKRDDVISVSRAKIEVIDFSALRQLADSS